MGAQDKSAALQPGSNAPSKTPAKRFTRATTISAGKIPYIDLTNDDGDVVILGAKKKLPMTPFKRKLEEEDSTDTASKNKKTATPRKKKDEEQRLKVFRKQAPQSYLQKLSRALEQRYAAWAILLPRELLTRLIGCSSLTEPVKAPRRFPKR